MQNLLHGFMSKQPVTLGQNSATIDLLVQNVRMSFQSTPQANEAEWAAKVCGTLGTLVGSRQVIL